MEIIDGKFYSMTTPERIELGDELFSFLGPVMNKIHETRYSERFWRILLAPYVTTINSRRKLFMGYEMKSRPGIDPINSFSLPTLKEKLIVKLKYNAKAYRTRKMPRQIEKTLSEYDSIAFGFHDPESVKKDIPGYFQTFYPFIPWKKDNKKRIRANNIAEQEDQLFHRNIIRQIPQSCIEYFDWYLSLIRIINPAGKTINTSMLENMFNRFLLAVYTEKGAQLNYYQHGAFYGEYRYYSPYSYEYSIADKYYTWGWKMGDKNIPWKAYRLNRFYRSYMSEKKNPIYDCLIVFPQISKQNFEEFRKSTSHLINNISREKFKSILIRPRATAVDLKYDEQFKFINDNRVTIDTGKSSIGKLISQSRLIIQYSYPGTNFLECLYVDHPSIVILKNTQPTEIVKPFYDFFLENGVFHYDFESLTSYLNNIDLDSWWKSVSENVLYKEYKNQFLRRG